MKVSLRMRWTVITAALALGVEGSGSAFTGAGADLPIIGSAWAVMIVALAVQAGVSMDKGTALKIATAMLMSFGSFLGGTKLAIQAFALTGWALFPLLAQTAASMPELLIWLEWRSPRFLSRRTESPRSKVSREQWWRRFWPVWDCTLVDRRPSKSRSEIIALIGRAFGA